MNYLFGDHFPSAKSSPVGYCNCAEPEHLWIGKKLLETFIQQNQTNYMFGSSLGCPGHTFTI